MRRLHTLLDRLRAVGEHPRVDDGERAHSYADLLRAPDAWRARPRRAVPVRVELVIGPLVGERQRRVRGTSG